MAFPEVGVLAVVENINGFLQDLGKMDNAVTGMADRADKAGGVIGGVGGKIASVGKAAATVAVAGIAAAGAAVVGLGVASLKTAIEFESAWTGVLKTTDGLVDELGNLTEAGSEMQTGFRDLAKEIPVSVEELLRIGEVGGQLGVASDDLIDFTETVAGLGVATDLSAEEAAIGLSRLSSVMGTSGEDFERLGSTIVKLGNEFETSEPEILNFSQRIAGAAKVAGVSESSVLGIGAAFTSVGIGAEAGGTAVSKVFLDMNKAALEGGEKMEIFAAVAGMEADKFGASWEEDAGAVFGEFVKGLGMAGDDAIGILDALEIKDAQSVRAFLSLAGAGDKVTDSMSVASEAFASNTALAEEAALRYGTTESQMIILKNTLKDVGITIGSALLPFFNDLLSAATPLINQLGKALPKFLNGSLIPALKTIGTVMSGVVDVIAGLIKGTVGIDSPFEDFFPPGIDKIAEKAVRAIVPIVDMLKAEIPKAVASARKFITGSLIPAFQQVGQFILTQVVPALTEFIGAVISFVQQHGPAIRNAILAIGAVLAGAAIIVQIMGIVAAIAALFNPVTLIIAAVALLAAAWTENWFGIREIVASVIGFLLPIFQALVDFVINTLVPAFISFGEFLVSVLTPIVQAFAAFMVETFAAIRDWVVANWPMIQETILAVLSAIGTAIQSGLSAVRAFWEENGEAIMATVEAAWSAIQDFVSAAVTLVQGVIQAAMQAIDGDWSGAWDTIQTTLKTAWNLIKDEVQAALNFIKDTVFPAALEALKTLWSAAWDFIETTLKTSIDTIKVAINAGLKAARDIVEFILNSIKDKVTDAWNAIPDLFQAGIEKAKSFITGAVAAFKSAGGAVVDAIKQGIEDAWDGLVSGLKSKLKELGDLLPFSEPKDPTSPLRGLGRSGAAIVENIAAGLAEAMPILQAQLGAALNPAQVAAPVTTIGGNVTTSTNSISIDVVSNPASQPSENAIYQDVQAALAAART